jgi:hypothetical protein
MKSCLAVPPSSRQRVIERHWVSPSWRHHDAEGVANLVVTIHLAVLGIQKRGEFVSATVDARYTPTIQKRGFQEADFGTTSSEPA